MTSEVFNTDCLEYMRTLPDKAFQLAIADPPYGIGRDGQKLSINKNPKHNRKYFEAKGWDKKAPPTSPPCSRWLPTSRPLPRAVYVWPVLPALPSTTRPTSITSREVEPEQRVVLPF